MKRTKWQFSLFFIVLSILIANVAVAAAAAANNDTQRVKETDVKTTKHKKHSSTLLPARQTKIIRNCSLAAAQRRNALRNKSSTTKLPNTQTVYVCHRTKKHSTSTKHHKHDGKKDVSKKTTKKSRHTKQKSTTTTKKRALKKNSTKKHTSKKHTSKKHSTKKHTIKKHSTKKHSTKKHTTKKHTTKKHTTKKHTTTKAITTTTTTKTRAIASTTTSTHQSGETSTTPIVATTIQTSSPVDNINDETSNTQSPNDGTTYDDYNQGAEEEEEDDSASLQASATPEVASSPVAPTDNNNQVSVQSIENGAAIDAKPQSTVIGVSVGAVVGCLAAAGLAGMFIYRRKQKSAHDQDVEDLNQNSEVNTRWRTQSFMAVVAGAVAKLPNRSNSSSSTRSIGVLGSIRRAASNASRSLSRSNSQSSTQSYGIAVSGPIPAIARIDGDQAQYYTEPASPSHGHHTHAY